MSAVLTTWLGRKSREQEPLIAANNRRRRNRQVPGHQAGKLSWRNSLGLGRNVGVAIEDFSSDGVAVRVPQAFEVGQVVVVHWALNETRGSIRYCRQEGSGFRAGVRLVPNERRRHERVSVGGLASLRWTDRVDGPRELVVNVANVGEEGIQIKMSEEVPALSHVRIVGDNLECLGLLLYCEQDGPRFAGGVQLVRPAYLKQTADYSG